MRWIMFISRIIDLYLFILILAFIVMVFITLLSELLELMEIDILEKVFPIDIMQRKVLPIFIFLSIFSFFAAAILKHIFNAIINTRRLEELDKEIQNLKRRILIVTSGSILPKEIKEVKGTVVGISNIAASNSLEFELTEKEALLDIMTKALELGVNCIIDLKMTTSSYGDEKSIVSKVMYTGTAVRI